MDTNNTPVTDADPVMVWLHSKLGEVASKISFREQSQECWSGGTEESWEAASKHAGCKVMGKKARLQEAALHARIAEKNRAEMKTVGAVIARVMEQDAKLAATTGALEKIIEMNRQHAKDQYGDPEKAESWACVRVAREALADSEPGNT